MVKGRQPSDLSRQDGLDLVGNRHAEGYVVLRRQVNAVDAIGGQKFTGVQEIHLEELGKRFVVAGQFAALGLSPYKGCLKPGIGHAA